MRTLDFKENKVQQLTLSELEHTYKENLIDGTPVGGVYHFVLIQQLLEIFEREGLKPEIQEIFAADNRDSKRPGVTLLPAIEEQKGEKALEAHVLRRVYANIALMSDASDKVVTNLAVAYHQKGIQVGIGPMVRVCHNQTILGAQDVASNYTCFGRGRLDREQRSLEAIMAKATDWAQNYGEHQAVRKEAVARMKSAAFCRDDLYRAVGILTEKRIVHDTAEPELHVSGCYPLNSAQINEVCEQLLFMHTPYMLKTNYPEGMTYWDAYQNMNYVLKPDQMDIPQVLPQSLALFETLTEMIK